LLLEAADLGVRFGGVWALHDFTLGVKEGEIHGFIGPNGSGKSTLFNLITGRYRPTTGSVSFDGRDLKGLDPDQRARLGITMKFQITSVFAGLSVFENIRLGLLGPRPVLSSFRAGASERQDRERAEEMLQIIGLRHKRDEPAGALAHGEKGWLEIGMALATEPKLLLLDEPASGMGADETRKTVELIDRIREGRTLLVIEHDMEFVRAVAESITVLFRGGLLTQGTYDEIKSDERVIDAYLGRGRGHGLPQH
jgi:branched-chain amino acid transport system ATP-binding protein